MKVCLLIFSSIIVFATSSAFANLSFSVTDNTPCAGENIIFNWTTSPSVDHYDIISPTNVTYTAFSSPKFIGTYSSVNSGVWILNAIDINGDIIETSTLNITVNELPVVTPQISVSNNTPCLGDVVTFKAPTISDVTYSWTGPDGFTSNSKTPSVNNIQTPAIGIYSLIITNTSTGCSSVPSANSETLITIKATPVLPIALESSSYSPCVGDTVLLTCPTLPGVTYAWTGPNGFSATIQNTTVPNIQVDKSGTYKLIATDISTGCTSVPSLVVLKVNSLPTLSTPVSASNNNPCLNGDVQFSAPTIPNVTYSWTGPNGFTSNLQNPSITNIQAANSGTYSVKITNLTTGCNSLESANTQLSINVKPIPVIDSNIVVSSNTPCLNGTVNFTAQSIAGVTYSWSGPNGFTSNLQNPSIANVQLINNGTYTLTVSNTATGCSSATSSKSSTILEVAPIPEISSPVSVSKNDPCVGEDVTLSAPSIPGVTYSWSGPNGFTSNQQNPTISAIQKSNSGTYTLTVASTATGCSSVSDPNVSQVVVNVKDTPELTVTVSASNDKPCENSSITLNAPSIANATYSWSGPNGFTSNVQNPVINNVQLSNNGLYSLVVTNTATTCSSASTASSQITLNVSAAPVYSFNRSLSACIGDTVELKGPVGDNTMSTWNGPDNFSSEVGSSGTYGIILQNVANKNIGTYNIKIQNMVTGCITYDSLVLSLKDAPKLTTPISVSNLNPCENSSVTFSAPSLSNTTYSWSGPNGFTSNQQNPIVNNLKISNNGVYTLRIKNTVSGCQSNLNDSAKITLAIISSPSIDPNVPISVNDNTPCLNSTVQFTAQSIAGVTYSWSGPNGFTSNQQNPSINNFEYEDEGIYTLILTDIVTGCSSASSNASSILVNIIDSKDLANTISTSSNTPCQNSDLTLSVPFTVGSTYSWTGPNGFSSSINNPTISNVQTVNSGKYSVTVLNIQSDCNYTVSGTAQINISVTPAPSLVSQISVSDTTPCINSKVNFYAPYIEGVTYLWSGPLDFSSTEQNPTINNFEQENDGIYSVTITDTVTGCSTSSDGSQKLVNVIDSKDLIDKIVPSNLNPCLNENLTLNAPSVPGSTFSWTGPNGFTSTEQNPIITNVTLANSGTYRVFVTNNITDCNYTIQGYAEIEINVNSAPVLHVTASTSNNNPCEHNYITLNASTIDNVNYTWTGPNGFVSNEQNPIISNIQLGNNGIYKVVAKNTTTGCLSIQDASSQVSINVKANNIPNFKTFDTITACIGEKVNFVGHADLSMTQVSTWYRPTIGEIFSSNANNYTIPSVKQSDAGLYFIEIQDITTGCMAFDTMVLKLNPSPILTTSVSVSNNTPCLNETVNFSAPLIANVTYSWTGPNGFSSNDQNPTIPNVQLSNNGTYTLTVKDLSNGCSSNNPAVASVTVGVIAAPDLTSNVTASSNTPCLNSTVNFTAPTVAGGTYSWTGPNGFTSNLQNPSIPNVQLINNGTYSLTVTNTATGCASASSANAQVTLTVKPLPTFIGQVSVSNNEPCQFETVNFTAPTISGVSYSWSGPNGFTSTLQNPSIANVQLANNGTYTLTIIDDATECSSETTASAQTILKIKSAPDLNTSVTASNNTPCINGDVQFNAPSISGATYAWSGPNGFTSNLQNPTITNVQIVNNGTYSLIVTNPATGCSTGSSVNASTTLKVSELPTLPSSVGASDNTPCLGGDVTLTGPDAPNTTYSWTGPNGFTSNEKNPNISDLQLTNNGVYTLTITNSATGCSSAVTAIAKTEIAINPLPVVTSSIVASNTTPCTNDEVVFVAPTIPNVTYSWVGPNGYTANTQNATVSNMQAVNSGKYSLIVTSTETGCSNAASANSEVDVTVNGRPTYSESPKADENLCVGDSLILTYDTIPNVSYFWSGPNGFTSNEQNPVIKHVTFEDNGTFIVKLKNTITGCEAIENETTFSRVEVEVNKLPVFNGLVSASNNTPCLGESVNFTATTIAFTDYEWTGPNGFISTVQNPVISSMAETNDGIYSLRIKNLETGCFSLVTPNGQTALTHKSTPVIATPITVSDNTPCTGEQVAFTAPTLNGVTYSWTGPNGFTSNVQNPMIANVQMVANGDYNLTATDANTGCKSIATSNSKVNLAVNQTPTISLQDSILSCNQDKFNLMLDQYDSYLWSTGETTRGIDVTKKGWYSVNVMNNGCKSVKDSIYVTMFKSDLAINKSQDGCLNDYFEFSATGGENYSWSGPNGFVSSDSIVKFLAVKQSNIGDYKVSVNYSNGCKDSSTFHLGILGDNYCFKIPEIITPNHDGKNDAFVIDWIDQYPNNKLTIVNRWGSTIFEASPYQNNFDGKSNTGLLLDSKNVPSGSYYYILNLDDKTPLKKGVVEIQN